MYAIFENGGKQYKVQAGDVIKVEKLDVNENEQVEFTNVLALVDGDNTQFGKPYVSGAKIVADVQAQGKHKKVIVYKFKSKKGFHKKKGHRQPFTQIKIASIVK